MKLWGVVLGCLLAGAAEANFMTGLLNMAATKAEHDQKVEAQADELVKAALKANEDREKIARQDANILLDEAAKLSVLAQAYNAGAGKDMTYSEAELGNTLPCGSDLLATKSGVATLILGDSCASGATPKDVRRQVERLGQERVYCEKNICQIDFKVKE